MILWSQYMDSENKEWKQDWPHLPSLTKERVTKGPFAPQPHNSGFFSIGGTGS